MPDATKMIPVEEVKPGDVVVTRKGLKLLVHSVVGMPGDFGFLGKRVDPAGGDALECWPVKDIPQIRILAGRD